MKCLPHNKLPVAHGNVLVNKFRTRVVIETDTNVVQHDWHAEILAIRTFNRFLLDQCLLLSTPPYLHSPWIQHHQPSQYESEHQPFTIRPDVQIHMYCSEAPCGDSSMELVMDAQEDATPWATVSTSDSGRGEGGAVPIALRGRANFALLGAVRCKPSRADAPPTLSKSCTDKLTLAQATSLLSSTTSLLISPRNAYIHTLVLPESQYVPSACERAFSRSGRLAGLSDEVVGSWTGGYAWTPFTVKSTTKDFRWSRRAVMAGEKAVGSNLSAVWTPSWQESLIGGVLQGRKQFDPRGASAICRRNIWKVAVQVAALIGAPVISQVLSKKRYADLKADDIFGSRKRVKRSIVDSSLKGWIRNTGDDDWTLDDP